jgi:hypothetical protein
MNTKMNTRLIWFTVKVLGFSVGSLFGKWLWNLIAGR